MDVVLGRERTQASQVIKQADVVALLALLPEEFPGTASALNFDHYAPRCGHGISLSRALHGLVAARLGKSELALGYLNDTWAIDLGDSHVVIAGSVHNAALGGVWLIAIFGFAGLVLRNDGLAFHPRIPPGWNILAFRLQLDGTGTCRCMSAYFSPQGRRFARIERFARWDQIPLSAPSFVPSATELSTSGRAWQAVAVPSNATATSAVRNDQRLGAMDLILESPVQDLGPKRTVRVDRCPRRTEHHKDIVHQLPKAQLGVTGPRTYPRAFGIRATLLDVDRFMFHWQHDSPPFC